MNKLVLVDDEYLVRERLKHVLNWSDYGFTLAGEAEQGRDGLSLICSTQADLAIIDINMPLLNGLEMAGELLRRKIKTKVIVLSGFSEFHYARKAIDLGVLAYLLKPVDTEELIAALDKFNALNPGYSSDSFYSPVIQNALEYIRNHFRNPDLSVEMIACEVGLNASYLSSKFKKETTSSLVKAINLVRLEEAEKYLKTENINLQELADKVGYRDPYYMSRCFRKYLNYSPSQVQKL